MPLLKVEADKLSQEDLVRGVIEEIIEKDDLFAILPFVRTNGKIYHYNREKTLSEGAFLDPYDTVPEGAATFEEVFAKLRILAGDVDIDNFLAETESDENDQVATQLAAKAKGLGRKFRRTLAQGDTTADAKSFDGIQKLVAAPQKISAGVNGNALTLTILDELLDAVPNGADAIIMRQGTIRAYRNLLRQTGGLEPAHIMIKDFGRAMLTHNGVPIIQNDYLAGNETKGSNTNTCSIYAARFNEADGLHGIYGGKSAGIRYQPIGTIQDKDAERHRLKWYAALALKSTKSLAAINGVTNI